MLSGPRRLQRLITGAIYPQIRGFLETPRSRDKAPAQEPGGTCQTSSDSSAASQGPTRRLLCSFGEENPPKSSPSFFPEGLTGRSLPALPASTFPLFSLHGWVIAELPRCTRLMRARCPESHSPLSMERLWLPCRKPAPPPWHHRHVHPSHPQGRFARTAQVSIPHTIQRKSPAPRLS